MDAAKLLGEFSRERPVGTAVNNEIADRLEMFARELGYAVLSLPFSCKTWFPGASFLATGNQTVPIFAGPFSQAFSGTGTLVYVESVEDLRVKELAGKIVILNGAIAVDPVMPKNYPFYYPDEHREINDILETKKPAAILALTGKHPMCGLDPFSLFNDVHFGIPHAYARLAAAAELSSGASATMRIDSTVNDAEARQINIQKAPGKKASGRIIISAHMDTDYGTPGALDNAVGLVVMCGVMERLKGWDSPFLLEFVPFNGEDYCEASGQVAYIQHNHNDFTDVRLSVNIDDAGLQGFQTAVSRYNFSPEYDMVLDSALAGNETMTTGEAWYASDHTIFAMRGIPAMALASTELMGETIRLTHTQEDTPDRVDMGLVEGMVDFITHVVLGLARMHP